jgi:hypothetical protein
MVEGGSAMCWVGSVDVKLTVKASHSLQATPQIESVQKCFAVLHYLDTSRAQMQYAQHVISISDMMQFLRSFFLCRVSFQYVLA